VYELARHAETKQPFYTMRFVRGRTLVEASRQFHERRLAGQPDPLELVALLSAFVAVCHTVAYAHSHRVIHRDLKGENILLGDFGEVIVLDWGLAKHLDAVEAGEPGASATGVPLSGYSDNLEHTMQGDVIGTPGYMAPEQAAGRLDLIDQRSDIYGLGAILYEILAGRPPFRGTTSLETILQVQRVEATPPRAHWADVPPALEAAALRALAKEPAARFQAASELAQVVQTWQEVQRRQAEDALQRQSEILQSILDNMSEGVVVADNDGQLLLVNPMAKRLLGDDCAQLLLGGWLEGIELLLPDRSTACCSETAPLARAIHGEVVDDAELFVRLPARPDGLWISANARPLRDKHGPPPRRRRRRPQHQRAQTRRGRAAPQPRTLRAGRQGLARRPLGLGPADQRGLLLAALEEHHRLRGPRDRPPHPRVGDPPAPRREGRRARRQLRAHGRHHASL
jgi:PAS domain-containing protein